MKKCKEILTKKGLLNLDKTNITATALYIASVDLKDFISQTKGKEFAKPKGRIKFIRTPLEQLKKENE